jgi:hypothetical protein
MARQLLALTASVCLAAGEQAAGHDAAERPVPFTRLTHIHGNGFTKPGQFMVRNRVEWHRTWLKVQEGRTPYTPLPEIDFNKYMLLVVTRGEITVGGHPITIEKITEGGKALHVSVLRETPGTCYVSEGYTYPTDAVLIPKTTKQIRWSYRDEIYDCPGAALP